MRIENTPDTAAIIASPTAVCRVTYGLGGSGPGIGISFGSSVLDEGCHLREVARMLNNLGLHEAAVQAMCTDATAYPALLAAGVPCKIQPKE
jgi:hypothetical protein